MPALENTWGGGSRIFAGPENNPADSKNILGAVFSSFGLSGYRGVNGRLADDLPSTPVALICLEGNEPAVFLQNSGRVVSVLLFPGGAGSVHQDFSRADGWFVPRLEPVEELLRGIDFDLLFGGSWAAPIQVIKDGWHSEAPCCRSSYTRCSTGNSAW